MVESSKFEPKLVEIQSLQLENKCNNRKRLQQQSSCSNRLEAIVLKQSSWRNRLAEIVLHLKYRILKLEIFQKKTWTSPNSEVVSRNDRVCYLCAWSETICSWKIFCQKKNLPCLPFSWKIFRGLPPAWSIPWRLQALEFEVEALRMETPSSLVQTKKRFVGCTNAIWWLHVVHAQSSCIFVLNLSERFVRALSWTKFSQKKAACVSPSFGCEISTETGVPVELQKRKLEKYRRSAEGVY